MALGILCLVLVGLHAGEPLLYSPASDARADDHVNPLALPAITGDRASRVVPLIADIMDRPGPLVLNIRSKDFASAARDLQEYRNTLANLDTLVIQLDLTEGELADFRRASRENYRVLAELLNGTERWTELETLEVRFRESGDSGMVTSIRYEGETLKRKLQDLYRDYLEQDEVILSTGEKFEIDTTKYRASIGEFREIVSSISRQQEEKAGESQSTGDSPLALWVSPDRASFGQTILMEGQLLQVNDSSRGGIGLFVDSARIATLQPGPEGSFSHAYRVERDRPGSHTVFAVYDGSLFSSIETFTIDPIPSELLLSPPRVQGGRVRCDGILSAGSGPVRGADIGIFADGKRVGTCQTGEDGSFRAEFRLAPGTYRLRAGFEGEGFPLLRSESDIHEVTVLPVPPVADDGEESRPGPDPVALLIGAGLVCLSGAGAFYYLRYRRHRIYLPDLSIALPGEPQDESFPSPDEKTPSLQIPAGISPEIPLPAPASGHHEMSLSHLFRRLRFAVSKDAFFRYPLSLTPRELCTLCRDARIRDLVCSFARGYEKVMYAGQMPAPDEEDRMRQAYHAILHFLEGTSH